MRKIEKDRVGDIAYEDVESNKKYSWQYTKIQRKDKRKI